MHCYGIFEEDKKHLARVYELTYEDYIENPGKCYEEIAHFIGTRVPAPPREDKFYHVTQWRNPTGLRVPEGAMENVTGAHNQKYFEQWGKLLNNSVFKRYYRHIAVKYEPKFATYGYSLTNGSYVNGESFSKAEGTAANVGVIYCLLANGGAFLVRSPRQFRAYIKQQLRANLPEGVKAAVKRVFGERGGSKGQQQLVSSKSKSSGESCR